MASVTENLRTRGTRVFVGKLAGTGVFDPIGDQVGRVYDVISIIRVTGAPQVVGLVVEVTNRRRVFVPISRVTTIKPGAVITTGLLNMRRFNQRDAETLIVSQLFDRVVRMRDGSGEVRIKDVAMEQRLPREWRIAELYVERVTKSTFGFKRAGETLLVSTSEVSGLASQIGTQDATSLIATTHDMKAADLADILRDLPNERMHEVASQLADERLADVLEELPDDYSVSILSDLQAKRAADVLDVMQPDDAADLMAQLAPKKAQNLLNLMEPEEAEDVRRLMIYEDNTAGGLMTTEPVILPPDATVAQLLANVRNEDIPPALAALAIVTRPPLETPTGKFIGVIHIQQALREPPQTLLGTIVDTDIEAAHPEDSISSLTRTLAMYNLTAVPIVDDLGHVLGAVSVDDVLDNLLPEDWRDQDAEITEAEMEGRING
ncbi:MAG TPA: magnesium transporter [Actinomyces sp.]|nr:CBS domain-containing protein [Acidobacteriota bacterium]HHT41544.1 magnesium transporter [Actinomyces sp.]